MKARRRQPRPSNKHEDWQGPRLDSRIPELDGLRGLAIALVVFWHYFVDIRRLPYYDGSWYSLITHLTWSGVDLFFVLSGFLICGILLDKKSASNYYRTFYFRRFYRILPLYAVWIALFFGGLYLSRRSSLGPVHQLFNASVPAWSYLVFAQNFFMASKQTFGPDWTGITWSLAVEEQFYLILPFLVKNLRVRTLVLSACGAIVGAPMLRAWFMHHGNEYVAPYTLLPCRADAFAFGVLAAVLWRNKRVCDWLAQRRLILWALLPATAYGLYNVIFNRWRLPQTQYSWLAAMYTALLLIVLIKPGALVRAVFGRSPLASLGSVAYGVYVIHKGVLGLSFIAIVRDVPFLHDASTFCTTLASLLAVLLLAAFSWRFFERPLIQVAHVRFQYKATTT